jgi:hypothetical protein
MEVDPPFLDRDLSTYSKTRAKIEHDRNPQELRLPSRLVNDWLGNSYINL